MSDSGVEALLQRILETLDRIERKLNERPTTTTISVTPSAPVYPRPTAQPDCGCPVNTNCMNTACPRRIQVTCSTGPDA